MEVFDWVISNFLPLNDPDTTTLLHWSSNSRSSPNISSASFSPFPAPGMCFKAWALITSRFSLPFVFLYSPAQMSILLHSICRKLVGITLLVTSIHTVISRRNTPLSLSSAAAALYRFDTKCGQIFHFFRPRQSQAWWSPEREETVREKRKAFDAAHRSVEERQTYISAYRHAFSVIVKSRLRYARRYAHLSLS